MKKTINIGNAGVITSGRGWLESCWRKSFDDARSSLESSFRKTSSFFFCLLTSHKNMLKYYFPALP